MYKRQLSAQAFTDGWFRTGDIATRDDEGFYYLVDRKKDMLTSGGENVYPAVIEATIAELSEVAEVAVVGLPDQQWGEKGVACIVVVPGKILSEQTVAQHCLERLAKYKVPKHILFFTALPRTPTGKLKKAELLTQLKDFSETIE